MLDIGLDLPKSKIVKNIKEAEKVLKQIGLPAILGLLLLLGGWEVELQKIKKISLK